MSRITIDDTILTNIANSIRSKDGGSDNISPLDFAQRILDIPVNKVSQSGLNYTACEKINDNWQFKLITSSSTENEYNRSVENKYRKSLDTMNISIQGNTQVEPCDIYEVKDNYAILYHIKISTKSSLLSHLFNQGYNATLLIKQEERSLEKLKLLLKNDNYFISPLTQNKIKVVYGIISRNIENKKLSDLPLFSQITLYRVLKNFNTIGVDAKCMYIEDMTQPASKKKKNKMKNKVNECKNFV